MRASHDPDEKKGARQALLGKVAIVTGASSTGIGGAIARRFARAGASLFLASTEDDADRGRIVADCRRLTGTAGRVECRVYDFTQADAAERMVADTLAGFGRVDVLVNNAGLRDRKPFGSFSGADFDRMIAVNLRAPFFASQAVLPAMRKQGGGRIIHVASQMGMVTAQDLSTYSLTKAALISLARSMSLELGKEGIAVNAVSPGPIATGYQVARLKGEEAATAGLIAEVPLGRFGTPDEVAEAVVFLATSDGDFIQGHNLVIDGGYINH